MEMFLNQIEVLGYKIDGADDNSIVGSIPVTLFAAPNDYINVSITGQDFSSNYCNVSLFCGQLYTDSLNLFVENYPEVYSLDVSLIGTSPSLNSLFNTVDLFISTTSDTVFSKEGELYVTLISPSSGLDEQSLDVTLTNEDYLVRRDLNIFLQNDYLNMVRALKLHIAGDGAYDGYIPFQGGLECYIERLPADKIDVFLQGVEDNSVGIVDMSIEGAIGTAGQIDISLPNISSIYEDFVEIFTSGY